MVKKALLVGMAFMGYLTSHSASAQIYPVVLSDKSCKIEHTKSSIMACKFKYQVSSSYSDKMWIRAMEGYNFESDNGKLAFKISNSPFVEGFLTINDGQVTQLTQQPSWVNIKDRQPPLKLELEYRIVAKESGRYDIPQMMPIEFGFASQSDGNQIVLTPLRITYPVVCAFRRNMQTVSLDSIKTNDIRYHNDRKKAGHFSIDVDCNSRNANVQMSFKDAINQGNMSDTLSTNKGVDFAQGVGLKLEHQNQKGFVTFSPEPASMEENKSHQWHMEVSGKTYRSAFDVYYVNTGGIVTAGKVEGKVIATIAFK